MVIEKIKWVIIVALFFVDVIVFYAGYRIGGNSAEEALAEKNQAIHECTEDLLGKCGNLYKYTAMLEDENARLNKSRGECQDANR